MLPHPPYDLVVLGVGAAAGREPLPAAPLVSPARDVLHPLVEAVPVIGLAVTHLALPGVAGLGPGQEEGGQQQQQPLLEEQQQHGPVALPGH